jgi:two-component system response regulator MprA
MNTTSVLLADDDVTRRTFFAKFLEYKGYAVTTAAGGLECLSQLARFVPDVVVLDLDLPWGGGDGVIARMEEELGPLCPPVVLMTNRPSSEMPPGILTPPVIQCLRRPFRLTDLVDSLRTAEYVARGRITAV